MSGKNLEVTLTELAKQFVNIKDEDQRKYSKIFTEVFEKILTEMKNVDEAFKKFSSTLQTAGSVFDGLKVSKPNEFDMNLVIKLPISYADSEDGIILEPDIPGFMKVKIGKAFDNLRKQQHWESHNSVTNDWRDDENYLLQSKFRSWLEGAVQKALNNMKNQAVVDNVTYTVNSKKSGPALTFLIRQNGFVLDVDLVPVLKFGFPRWPNSGKYRAYDPVKFNKREYWFLVPKPNKAIGEKSVSDRLWRLAFPEQEREIIIGTNKNKLRPTLKLMKKMRDNMKMKGIASYYIKTLFLWEVEKRSNETNYWGLNYDTIFKEMVERLLTAVTEKKIPFYWNKDCNLLSGVKDTVLREYERNLQKVLLKTKEKDVETIAGYILTPEELAEYQRNNKIVSSKSSDTLSQASSSSLQSVASSPNPAKEYTLKEVISLLGKLITSNNHIVNKLDRLEEQINTMQGNFEDFKMEMKMTWQEKADKMAAASENISCMVPEKVENEMPLINLH